MDTSYMRKAISLALAVFCVLATAPLHAQVTIPDDIIGRYDLTLAATPQSPIRNGADTIIEISSEGLLCADGIEFSSPFVKSGIANRIFWSNIGANLEFSIATVGAFAGITLAAANGTSYGTLTGTKDSNTPLDCGLSAINTDLFELVENEYPDLFPASIFVFTQSNNDSEFRFYPSTGLYLAVTTAGAVIITGGDFGNGTVVGQVAEILEEGELDLDPYIGLPQVDSLDFRVSTYTLRIANARPFSPVPPGTTLTFVLTRDYRLCVGETILEPTLTENGGIVWNNVQGGYFYRFGPEPVNGEVPDWDWEINGSFTLVDSRGFVYGEFQGNRTSLDAECGDRVGADPDLAEIGVMFALAEKLYPDVFPGGPQTFSRRNDGTLSRHYEESGVSVFVTERRVSATGGPYGAGTDLGLLEDVITGFREQEITIAIPAALSGSYRVAFTSAGPHTQIPNQSNLDLSLDQNGNLCFEGQILMNPYLDPNDPDVIVWENVEGGFRLSLDTSTITGNNITLVMTSSQNLALGQMAGAKTQMLPVCGGLLGNGVDMETAQFLFASAESFMADTFPPSALTFNRLEGGKLLRYYPDTRVLVTIEDNNLTVSGGSFGSAPVILGTLPDLKRYFLQTYDVEVVGSAALQVVGTRSLSLSNAPTLKQDVDITQPSVLVPDPNDIVAMRKAVQNALGNELRSGWVGTFRVVTNTVRRLVFDVEVNDKVNAGHTTIDRRYQLRFTYDR